MTTVSLRTWVPDGEAPRLPRSRDQYVAGPVKIITLFGTRLIIADLYTAPSRGDQ